MYQRASYRVFCLMIMICWALTSTFHFEQFESNPIMDRLGYNNWCVGFDTQPANAVGSVFEAFIIYLAIRGAWTDIEVVTLMHEQDKASRWQRTRTVVIGIVSILSWLATALIFAVHPTEFRGAVWVHTIAFLQMVPMMVITQWNQYVVFSKTSLLGHVFFSLMGLMAVFFVVGVTIDYIAYDAGRPMPVYPPLLMAMDYGWFGAVLVSPCLLAPAHILHIERTLAEIDVDSEEHEMVSSMEPSDLDGASPMP